MKKKLTPLQAALLKKLKETNGKLEWSLLQPQETAAGTSLSKKGLAKWATQAHCRVLLLTEAGKAFDA